MRGAVNRARLAADHVPIMDKNTAYGIYIDKLRTHSPIWRRLWFLISVVPRYLISGSIEVP